MKKRNLLNRIAKLVPEFVVIAGLSMCFDLNATVNYEPYTFTTFAGGGGSGVADGIGNAARFSGPHGVAVDASGTIYVADTENSTIRMVSSSGTVTTFAGMAGTIGSVDGNGKLASFYSPYGVAIDGMGNAYVADTFNNTIRKITSAGDVTTFAGLVGTLGNTDGTGSAARFNMPEGIAVDGSNNVYVADYGNYTIRKITPSGVVTTLAGLANTKGTNDGSGSVARFYHPYGVALDGAGNVYVGDSGNHTIRKITPLGGVTTLAGSPGVSGSANGLTNAARFNSPLGVAVDASNNVFVADYSNRTIRKIASDGTVTTLAGLAGNSGSTDGIGSSARFSLPIGVTVDLTGNVYVADINCTIRKITPLGVVTTLAGFPGGTGSIDDLGNAARFLGPYGATVDGAGTLYVADSGNNTIRKITAAGAVTTFAGLAGSGGNNDGSGNAARFNSPYGIAADSSGNLFVADTYNHAIRKITSGGVVTTLAGGSFGTVDGIGTAAKFNQPYGVAADGLGNVFVADTFNATIRKITSAGVVTTFAGLAGSGGTNDGTGNLARFSLPYAITVDGTGTLYVVDGNKIRKITPAAVVTTFAGGGSAGNTDGIGVAARFNQPYGVAVDRAGNVYVGDSSNGTVRKITPTGTVTTLAGLSGTAGTDDGTGSAARFGSPYGVAVDGSGTLYVSDYSNSNIRKGTVFRPPIAISFSSGQTKLQWQDVSSTFVLEVKTNINSTSWISPSGTFSATNGTNTATVQMDTPTKFFRLRKP